MSESYLHMPIGHLSKQWARQVVPIKTIPREGMILTHLLFQNSLMCRTKFYKNLLFKPNPLRKTKIVYNFSQAGSAVGSASDS